MNSQLQSPNYKQLSINRITKSLAYSKIDKLVIHVAQRVEDVANPTTHQQDHPMMNSKELIITTWNAGGMGKDKLDAIVSYLRKSNPHILTIQEAQGTKEPPQISGYTTNLTKGRHPILTFFKNDLAYRELFMQEDTEHPASTSATFEIQKNHVNVILTSVYINPSAKKSFWEQWVPRMETIVKSGKNSIIMGDTNAKHESWNKGKPNYNGTKLNELIRKGFYQIINNIHSPGYITSRRYRNSGLISTESTIDLVMSNNPGKITQLNIMYDHQMSGEHSPIRITWQSDAQTNNSHDTEMKWNIGNNADQWAKYKEEVETRCKEKKIEKSQSINQSWKQLESILKEAMIKTFGLKQARKLHPHWSTNIKVLKAEAQLRQAKRKQRKKPSTENKRNINISKENLAR